MIWGATCASETTGGCGSGSNKCNARQSEANGNTASATSPASAARKIANRFEGCFTKANASHTTASSAVLSSATSASQKANCSEWHSHFRKVC
jgi:hypothetical protein